ncbi:energy transducer TonB [Synoicihabitans lomoniglobus]|uniref:Energy transducer TonB n=1 Tax=Synoicihabitans lomoniglobus TaxID=2909285 RepID=A0AAE9ZUP6_9BACT|nr:energy transducer TonB [Opitutaceae bacterium LMO-M01]WED64621.1 energy transducer TonB [Opitutaceae bacterium LMO-M01]
MTTQLLTVTPAVVRATPRQTPAASVPRPAWNVPPSSSPETRYDPGPGAWHYETGKLAPKIPWIALLISGSLHGLAIFGFNDKPVAEEAVVFDEELAVVFLEMPPIEELDKPEEIFDGDAVEQEELDPGAFVPMQSDVPSIVTNATFVQQLDFQSLLPKPDFDAAKVVSIPSRIARGGVSAKNIKDLFDLKDLDRVPVPLMQQPPVFPSHLKDDVKYAEVVVDFIVDAKGKVPWAKIYSSSHSGFEDAAILGVSRWQFRPGMKGGKQVATRMRVPVQFRIVDD